MARVRCTAVLALLVFCAAGLDALVRSGLRRGVWFCGDFETGGLDGWSWDISRRHPAEVVRRPVRKGRYAVRITLGPGDIAASKERAELKVGDKSIERIHGGQGGEIWYGWSLWLPAGYVHPSGGQFQILSQWHHRPVPQTPGARPRMIGAPPLALYLVLHEGQDVLVLIGQPSPKAPPRHLASQAIRRETWIDLVFHIKASTGNDGLVEAWLDGRPFTAGKMYGPTLYSAVSNYLRFGLYRRKGVPATNHVYYDEVRLGDSYEAAAP
jgi:hypothetical protein